MGRGSGLGLTLAACLVESGLDVVLTTRMARGEAAAARPWDTGLTLCSSITEVATWLVPLFAASTSCVPQAILSLFWQSLANSRILCFSS
jgi:hypothetical protein